ncbi:universal stress protein [Streptomyces sp. NPDC003442]
MEQAAVEQAAMEQVVTVGLDGSAESLAAAHWAADEAERRELPPRTARTAQAPEMRKLWAQEALEDAKARLPADWSGVSVSTELVSETAVEAPVAWGAASEMLVLGSHGRGAVGGFLLGSVGLRVLALSKSPVVMVRGNGGARTGVGTRDVVVGIQDPPESAAPIEFAFATEVLLGAAAQAGVMVVGRPTHRPAVGPRLGHVAHALLHHAACPVAVVPHAP